MGVSDGCFFIDTDVCDVVSLNFSRVLFPWVMHRSCAPWYWCLHTYFVQHGLKRDGDNNSNALKCMMPVAEADLTERQELQGL